MNRPQAHKRLIAIALLVALSPALLISNNRVHAASATVSDKVSPDLRQLIQSGRGGSRVRLIVQSSSTSSLGLIGSLLQTVNGVLVATLSSLNLSIIDVTANSVDVLAADSSVAYVSLDAQVRSFGHVTTTTGAQQVRAQKNALGLSYTLDGSGVNIAILDSGIDTTHKSFTSQAGKVIFSKDFTGENRTDDPYGHGTFVAAVAAGSGTPTGGKYEGVASAANLVNLRVLNSQGSGSVSGILKALDWIMANRLLYNVRVVNMSLGAPALSSYKNDPICQAVRKLSDAGIVVVAAAGNSGKTSAGQKIYGGIHSPGNEPSAITVGASNTYGSDTRNEDTIATYSSRGPTRSFSTDNYGVKHYDNLIKPDLVAPGNKIVSAEAANNYLVSSHPELETNNYSTSNMKLMSLSGTSVSAPMVSGAAAMLLEANPNLTPNMVKMILMYTAQPLSGFNTFEQGAGQLNVAGAVAVAKLVRTSWGLLGLGSPSLGASLLTQAAPTAQTTISSYSFPWAQGLVVKHGTITGTNLITKYQTSYGKGYVLGDGVV